MPDPVAPEPSSPPTMPVVPTIPVPPRPAPPAPTAPPTVPLHQPVPVPPAGPPPFPQGARSPSSPPRLRAFGRAHRLSCEVAALVVALLAGTGVGLAFGGGSNSTPASAAFAPPATAVPPATTPASKGTAHHRFQGIRGTISALSGTSWTVTTKAGSQVAVVITPTTRFGTAATSATQAQFVVGSPVVVIGTPTRTGTGTTLTARRVFPPKPTTTQLPATTVPGSGSPSSPANA